MANDELKYVVSTEADVRSATKTGEDLAKHIAKGIGNDGYVKLGAEITKYKYPKKDAKAISGPHSIDYSGLQKAQDKLISDWKKLSDKGFSSHDEKIISALRSYREYQGAVKRHYGNTINDTKDKQVTRIRETIGDSLNKYFTRLLPLQVGKSKNATVMDIKNDEEFEREVKRVLLRHKAAKSAGIDLSKKTLTASDKKAIDKEEQQLYRETKKKQDLEEREYEVKHAKKIAKTEQKQYKKILKEREKTSKKAVTIPESNNPPEEVSLSTTEVVDLATPTDYKQTREDKRSDKHFVRDLGKESYSRKNNTPQNDISLGIRSQVWNPAYVVEDFLEKMERGGTYTDTNSLLRQTFQALPEEIRRANEEMIKYIDKDLAIAKYTELEGTEKERWEKEANEIGMSQLLLKNVAKVQGALMAGKPEIEPEHLINAIAVAVDDAVRHGKSEIAFENYKKAMMSIVNMLMNRYNTMRDKIGSNVRVKHKGRPDDSEIGVGPNYELVADTIRGVFSGFQKTADDLLKLAVKEFPEFYGGKNSYEKEKKKMSTFDKVFSERLAEIMGNVNDSTKQTLNATETQTRHDLVENAAERVADSKEGKANRQLIDDVQSDARTGMNTDANAAKLFAYLETIGTFADELAAAYTAIALSLEANTKKDDGGKGGPPRVGGWTPPNGSEPPKSFNDDILTQIKQSLKNIDINTGHILQKLINPEQHIPTSALTLVPGQEAKTVEPEKEPIEDKTDYNALAQRKAERDREAAKKAEEEGYKSAAIKKYEEEKAAKDERDALKAKLDKLISGELPSSVSTTEIVPKQEETKQPDNAFAKLQNTLKNVFSKASRGTSEVDKIMQMNEAEQAQLLAKRRKEYGFANTLNKPTDTGDVAQITRTGFLWRRKNKEDAVDTNPFRGIQITPGMTVDYKGITDALQTAIERNQFHAQTGGGFFKQVLGSMTLYAGQDSIEKSRAEADALNSIMQILKDTINELVAAIQTEERTLTGMEKSGDAVFDDKGMLTDASSNEAFITAARLEELKLGLKGVLAEAELTDDIAESVDGNVKAILQKLGFAAPELQKCNAIIRNVNSGLDKTGKALKFQTRTQETLNYAYQLMARHVGQMVKSWMMMLNPLTGIKKLFSDFASYDVKWQRTMNVIKYNLRRIVKPMMEWIAQTLVNMIGLVNALIKGIGKAFGKDWDLFDQDAANAEKIREEMEQAANVSAGFDELHDISGETSGGNDPAMDLLGDIYTPEWDGLNAILEKIGETIGKIIKAVSDWTFWDWLKLIGAALVGYIALKWLIGLFSKKNPLESVAKGFSFLEKAVGWAILIWAFTSFTKALTEFVECMKTANLEDVAKVLITLTGAFAALAGAAGLLMWFSSVLAMSAPALLGVAAIAAAFALFTSALTDFVECMKTADLETIGKSLFTLAGAFATLGAASGMMMAFASMLGMNGPALLGLGAIAGAFALFTEALVPFIETMKGVTDVGTIIGSIVELVGAFTALAIGMGLASKLFHAMDWSSIGQLAVIAGIFDLFMLSLIPFINGIKDIPWETLAAGAVLIAGAFVSLGGAIALAAPAIKLLDWTSVLQLVVVMAAFAGVIWVLKEFVLALQTLSEGQIATGLQSLGATLLIVAGAIGVLAAIFTALVATGVGALAIGLLAGVLAVSALVIVALADLVTALGESGEGIKLVLEGVATVIESIGTQITGIFQTIADGVIGTVTAIGEAIATVITSIGDAIATVIGSVASGIESVLTSISDFVDNVLDKIIDLAVTVSHEVGETIRSVVETVGDVIVRIIESVVTAIQNLMTSILNFIRDLGPAIDSFVTSLCNTITRMVNFIVSAFEYVLNVGVSVINGLISAANKVPGVNISYASKVSIARFVPKYEKGTNYVPNDGLAYLHEGEAVIPKKYNTPYNPTMSAEEKAYMQQMISTMKSLDGTMKRGISVNGQFVQRGSDLVAVVNKTKSQTGADLLSNVSYAR